MAISKASVLVLLTAFMTAQGCFSGFEYPIGYVWRFMSYNFPDFYIRHKHFRVHIDKFETSRLYGLDSSWKIVRGLCGYGISFQSKNFPDHYLRHRYSWIRIDKYQNNNQFKMDACFISHRGLAAREGFSFESANFRGFYLRHRFLRLRIDQTDGSMLFKKDATFFPRYAFH